MEENKIEIRDPRPQSHNPKSATLNPKPKTRIKGFVVVPAPGSTRVVVSSRSLKSMTRAGPETRNPQPAIPNPKSCIRNPKVRIQGFPVVPARGSTRVVGYVTRVALLRMSSSGAKPKPKVLYPDSGSRNPKPESQNLTPEIRERACRATSDPTPGNRKSKFSECKGESTP